MAVRQIPNRMVVESETTAFMQLEADTESDLDGLDTLDGMEIAFGSICFVIDTGRVWIMNSSGTWVEQR